MEESQFTQANLAAWDEAAPLHRRQNQQRLIDAFKQPGFSCLDEVETALLTKLGVAGKDVVQICCNNGRELLSVKNMGAGRCLGIDGSALFVEQARELAAAGGLDCQFECADIYGLADKFDASFDLATVTIGVICWMPDLGQFFAIAARLLRPGGALFIYEQHPILDMIVPGTADEPVTWTESYFSKEPIIDREGLDYYGGGTYPSKTMYNFRYTMSDIIQNAIDCSFGVEHFREYPKHISNTWYNVFESEPKLPMSYSLILRKPD